MYCRLLAFHLKQCLHKELDKMEEAGIIEDHTEPAPWISNIAPKGNGDVQVTVDMRRPNQAIKDTRIPIPHAEDIRAELAGCEVFSKLDFKSAFYQLELTPESRLIIVFNDGEKLKWYTCLTMGTKPVSGEVNKALCLLFNAIPEAHMIHGDLIIAAKSPAQHDLALERVLAIIHDSGLTLNDDKCVFKAAEIRLWVHPDPSKVEALKDALPLTNKSEVMSFL